MYGNVHAIFFSDMKRKEILSCSGLSWVMKHYEPASNHQNMEWKHMSSPWTKKFRSIPSAGIVIILFWGLICK
jgi:hypothetical protein